MDRYVSQYFINNPSSEELEMERQRILKVLDDHMSLAVGLILNTDDYSVGRQLKSETQELSGKMVTIKILRTIHDSSKYPKEFAEIDQQFEQIMDLAVAFFNKLKLPQLVVDLKIKEYFHFVDAEFWWLFGNKVKSYMADSVKLLETLEVPKEKCQHNDSPTDWVYCRKLVARKPFFTELLAEWKQLDLQTKADLLHRQTEDLVRIMDGNRG